MLNLPAYLPYLLNRAGVRIANAFSRQVRDYGITLPIWRVLAALLDRDGQQVGALSEMTSIEVSTLSRVLDHMQAKLLVERRRHGQDARKVTVHLTETGHHLANRILPLARHYETVALSGFTAAEAEALKAMLVRLFNNMARLEEEIDTREAG